MTTHTFTIPVYQTSEHLEECVQHLLAQSVKSKIIFTTSTPTDYSKNIAQKYNIPYHVNPKQSLGIAGDWNFALSTSDTQLVTIAHQDDIYETGYTEAVVKQYERYAESNPLILFTNYRDIVNDKIRKLGLNAIVKQTLLLPLVLAGKLSSKQAKKNLLKFGNPICCPSVTFNKALLGDFRFADEYQCALDWQAWYELSKRDGAFIYINRKLIQHRIHRHSETTRQLQSGRRYKEELQMFEQLWGKPFARIIGKIYKLGHADNL